MEFAAWLVPCETCGSRELGKVELYGNDEVWSIAAKCPSCGTQRVFSFPTIGAPYEHVPKPNELGDGPSTLITEEQFRKELALASLSVVSDPTFLAPAEWHTSRNALRRALTCINELLKLAPDRQLEVQRAAHLEIAKRYASPSVTRCS
jgi:hypothetical protein